MYEGQEVQPANAADAPVIWLDHGQGAVADAPAEVAGREADPEAVIEFLLKKLDEARAKAADQEAYAELLSQENEQLRGQLQVTREELDRQLADYDVLMQNALATERELEGLKQRQSAKPKIQLPFHTEQKLAELGWSTAAEADRQAV